nr:MAG TPA: hypothetical protein [Caudoviricetes sp.]
MSRDTLARAGVRRRRRRPEQPRKCDITHTGGA